MNSQNINSGRGFDDKWREKIKLKIRIVLVDNKLKGMNIIEKFRNYIWSVRIMCIYTSRKCRKYKFHSANHEDINRLPCFNEFKRFLANIFAILGNRDAKLIELLKSAKNSYRFTKFYNPSTFKMKVS